MNIVVTISGMSAEEKSVISICIAHALRAAGFGVSNPVENDRLSFLKLSSGIADLVANDTLIDIEIEPDEQDTIPCPPSFEIVPCVCCGTKEKVTFAPDPYLSDLRNDQTPVHMCEHCRVLAAREL